MTNREALLDFGGTEIHRSTCIQVPWNDDVIQVLKNWRLDDRWPFYMWELAYRSPTTERLWVPQGGALGAKLLTLVHVVGPWRVRRDVRFTVVRGGGYDPIWDANHKVVTHRSSRGSQHQYRQHEPGWESRKAGGTGWDIRPSGDEQPNEDDIAWLKSLRCGPEKQKVSIGVYYPGRGNFIHVDLRPGRPWRERMK